MYLYMYINQLYIYIYIFRKALLFRSLRSREEECEEGEVEQLRADPPVMGPLPFGGLFMKIES